MVSNDGIRGSSLGGDKFWVGKRVVVTGGAGFIGSHLVEELIRVGAQARVADSFTTGSLDNLQGVANQIEISRVDLSDFDDCIKACSNADIIMNLAAKVAGVAYNSLHSSEMFSMNVRIGMNMLEAARASNVDRFLCVSSACVYSREAKVPTPEEQGFFKEPEPSNLGYGWAKRVLEVQARLYAEQYGMKIAIVRPFNTYGPRDHFASNNNHVIPSLLTRVLAEEDPLTVWGNGKQTRSFVYVADMVRGLMLATEKYAEADPLNLGSSEEISIEGLSRMIVDLARPGTRIKFDESKPQGQPRRCPDVSKAKAKLGFESSAGIKTGLRQTLEWLREHERIHGVMPLETNAFET